MLGGDHKPATASQQYQHGMVATTRGANVHTDFQDGDQLMYDVKVKLPRVVEGQVVTKMVERKTRKTN